jgi:tRNA(Arg) A34 adenosine deaminase TadA
MSDHDLATMRIALKEAQAAAGRGETPVGAVVVDPASRAVIARAGNSSIGAGDPTAHAEILALREAARVIGNYRLTGLSLFVTLEPCAMCAGAISHARIGRLVFGAADPKGGAVIHGPRFFEQPTCHWRPAVTGGVLEEESVVMLRAFFRVRRGRLVDEWIAKAPRMPPGEPDSVDLIREDRDSR